MGRSGKTNGLGTLNQKETFAVSSQLSSSCSIHCEAQSPTIETLDKSALTTTSPYPSEKQDTYLQRDSWCSEKEAIQREILR
jgi:hypothetical protein